MAIVEDALSSGRIVLQFNMLERRVVLCLGGHDVNGRLPGSIRNGKAFCPFVWPCNDETTRCSEEKIKTMCLRSLTESRSANVTPKEHVLKGL